MSHQTVWQRFIRVLILLNGILLIFDAVFFYFIAGYLTELGISSSYIIDGIILTTLHLVIVPIIMAFCTVLSLLFGPTPSV